MTHPASRPADPQLVRGRHLLGTFELIFLTDGTFRLDGGAMFGVVPRTLWQKRLQPDENNCVLLGLNTLVIRTPSATVLIETGIGNKQPAKMREIHQNQELLPHSLAAAGIHPQEITHVVNTHLHFDHCGWNTTLHPDGRVTPTFPNARYLAHAGELAHAHRQLDRDRVSYNSPNYDPLLADGRMTLVDAGSLARSPQIVPGVWLECFPGHTANMLGIHIEPPGGPHACYIGDLFPTSAHLDPTWVMGFDLDPLRTIEERKRYLARAIPQRWLTIFTHDHHVPAGTLSLNEKGKPIVEPLFPELCQHLQSQPAT